MFNYNLILNNISLNENFIKIEKYISFLLISIIIILTNIKFFDKY